MTDAIGIIEREHTALVGVVDCLNHLAKDMAQGGDRADDDLLDAILEYIAAKRMPRILVGDMNGSPAWRTYKRLAEQLQDAAVAAGTAAPTWGYRPGTPAMLRIDHAFVEGVIPLATHTVRIKGSDHWALVVDLYME